MKSSQSNFNLRSPDVYLFRSYLINTVKIFVSVVSTPACTVQGNCIEYKNQLSVACYKGLNLINNH